jgi:hypothetical protein
MRHRRNHRKGFVAAAAGALLLAAFLAAGTGARADTVLVANLTHSQETVQGTLLTSGGVPRPLSFGMATFVLNDSMTSMSFTATIFNIDFTGLQTAADTNDDLIAAHIHNGPPGENGPVVWGFFGAPFNDNNPNDVVINPFSSGVGGTISGKWDLPEGNNTTLAAQLNNILVGNTYINFHTNQFRGGEVRGQIVVPEPSTALLFGVAALGLLGVRRKRRRS